MPDRIPLVTAGVLGALAVANAVVHAYRYYRYITYGEPLP